MVEQYRSPEWVADRLGLDYQTVWRLCMSGELRSVRPKGLARRLIAEESVNEYLFGRQDEGTVADVHELRGG